ncbi:MAG: hypothetical protein ACR2K0_08305 [Acidimicrobiales bacterium]
MRAGYRMLYHLVLGLEIFFDTAGICDLVFANRFCLPTLEGTCLFLRSWDDVVAQLATMGEVKEQFDDGGRLVVLAGRGLAIRSTDPDGERIDQVGVWRSEAWDEQQALWQVDDEHR